MVYRNFYVSLPAYITRVAKKEESMLIEELINEHADIYRDLLSMKKKRFSTEDELSKFSIVIEKIVSHLIKEDDRLYPVLREKANNDSWLKNILDTFAYDMDNISKSVMQFYERYYSNKPDYEFAKEYGRITAYLKIRIRIEERIIYKEYERIKG